MNEKDEITKEFMDISMINNLDVIEQGSKKLIDLLGYIMAHLKYLETDINASERKIKSLEEEVRELKNSAIRSGEMGISNIISKTTFKSKQNIGSELTRITSDPEFFQIVIRFNKDQESIIYNKGYPLMVTSVNDDIIISEHATPFTESIDYRSISEITVRYKTSRPSEHITFVEGD